jgi:mannose-6-phosphate isomerase
MSELYPLLMMPEFHERVWGTRDLAPIYSRIVGKEPIGEAWLTGEQCKVANGPFSGTTLAELCRRFGRGLVGETAPEPNRFPLLIKFLFPKEKLSVQVHPDDEGARALGLPNGKTECWYVARSVAGAQVGLGLKQGVTRDQFAHAIAEKRAEDLMNWIDVKTGDMIYVDAGTVHAIAPGAILIEAQQNSDTTFRLYDYGRPRELHVEQGMRAVREKTAAGKVIRETRNGHDVLVTSPYFVVERYNITEPKSFTEKSGSSAQILVAVAGAGAV